MSNIGVWENPAPGVRRKIMVAGSALMTMEVQFEQGAVGSLHTHPHEQATYCVSGRFAFTVDGVTRDLVPGDCILIPGGAPHEVVALEAGALVDAFTPVREDLIRR